MVFSASRVSSSFALNVNMTGSVEQPTSTVYLLELVASPIND